MPHLQICITITFDAVKQAQFYILVAEWRGFLKVTGLVFFTPEILLKNCYRKSILHFLNAAVLLQLYCNFSKKILFLLYEITKKQWYLNIFLDAQIKHCLKVSIRANDVFRETKNTVTERWALQRSKYKPRLKQLNKFVRSLINSIYFGTFVWTIEQNNVYNTFAITAFKQNGHFF